MTFFTDAVKKIMGSEIYTEVKKNHEKRAVKIAALAPQLETLLNGEIKHDETVAEAMARLALEIGVMEREAAEKKAEATLLEHLTEEQKDTWQKARQFDVKGQTMTYRLSGVSGGVQVIEGPWTGYLCVYSTKRQNPKADELLGMKLYIEANEAGFLKTANPDSQSGWYLTPDGGGRSTRTDRKITPQQAPAPLINNYAWYLNALDATALTTTTTINTINTTNTFLGNPNLPDTAARWRLVNREGVLLQEGTFNPRNPLIIDGGMTLRAGRLGPATADEFGTYTFTYNEY